jgi:hypothetical protein
MKNIQSISDNTAISLSLLCIIHCLALPLIIVMLPTLTIFNLQDEAVHFWMLGAVIPTSLFALTMGCRKHNNYNVIGLGIVGLTIILASAFLGHVFGETGETVLTTVGAIFIAVVHLINQRLCRQSNCQCTS